MLKKIISKIEVDYSPFIHHDIVFGDSFPDGIKGTELFEFSKISQIGNKHKHIVHGAIDPRGDGACFDYCLGHIILRHFHQLTDEPIWWRSPKHHETQQFLNAIQGIIGQITTPSFAEFKIYLDNRVTKEDLYVFSRLYVRLGTTHIIQELIEKDAKKEALIQYNEDAKSISDEHLKLRFIGQFLKRIEKRKPISKQKIEIELLRELFHYLGKDSFKLPVIYESKEQTLIEHLKELFPKQPKYPCYEDLRYDPDLKTLHHNGKYFPLSGQHDFSEELFNANFKDRIIKVAELIREKETAYFEEIERIQKKLKKESDISETQISTIETHWYFTTSLLEQLGINPNCIKVQSHDAESSYDIPTSMKATEQKYTIINTRDHYVLVEGRFDMTKAKHISSWESLEVAYEGEKGEHTTKWVPLHKYHIKGKDIVHRYSFIPSQALTEDEFNLIKSEEEKRALESAR